MIPNIEINPIRMNKNPKSVATPCGNPGKITNIKKKKI